MWRLGDFKHVFIVVGLVGVLAFSLPSLSLLWRNSKVEAFSELYVLGPSHMAEDYPFEVKSGQDNFVFVGVTDHLGSAAYYEVQVKLRNGTEPLPNATESVPSSLPELYRFRAFVVDSATWEGTLTFQFLNVDFEGNVSRVGKIVINNIAFDVNKSVQWDATNKGYYCQIFMELWIYEGVSSGFQYHNRFVGLWLNLTDSP